MTNIPIKQKKGVPWWVWLLVVLAILVGLWLLLAILDSDDDVDVANPAEPVTATVAATTDPKLVTDLLIIVDTDDPDSLVGRRVKLESVAVQSVVGDKTFWVGPSKDQQLFVFLEEKVDPAGAEGQVDVNEGQQVTITGTVEKLPPIEQARKQFDLSEKNSADLKGEKLYVRAAQVKIQ